MKYLNMSRLLSSKIISINGAQIPASCDRDDTLMPHRQASAAPSGPEGLHRLRLRRFIRSYLSRECDAVFDGQPSVSPGFSALGCPRLPARAFIPTTVQMKAPGL